MLPLRSRTALGAAVLALTASTLAAFGGSPAATGAAPSAGAAQPTVRVGTYNIRAGVPMDGFKDAVNGFKPYADVIGLQEIGSNERNKWLVRDNAWGYYRPPALQQNPILWRRAEFAWLDASGYKIAEKRDLGGEHSGSEAKGDSWATAVRLMDRETGQRLSFINVHLVRGAVKGGRKAPGKPKLFKLYTDQVVGLIKAVKAEQDKVDQVFVLGDFNVGFEADLKRKNKKLPYRKFKKIGYRSMWQGSPLLKKKYGTHNDALIDQVWSDTDSSQEEILRSLKASDHWPAVATYDLDMKKGYVPQTGTIGFDPAFDNHMVNEGSGKRKQKNMEFRVVGDLAHGFAELRINGTATWSDTYQQGDYLIDISELYDLDTSSPARIYVDFQGDTSQEPDETIELSLVNHAYTTAIEPSAVTGTIVNDDY